MGSTILRVVAIVVLLFGALVMAAWQEGKSQLQFWAVVCVYYAGSLGVGLARSAGWPDSFGLRIARVMAMSLLSAICQALRAPNPALTFLIWFTMSFFCFTAIEMFGLIRARNVAADSRPRPIRVADPTIARPSVPASETAAGNYPA